jgi:hypothetical protein
MGMLERFLAFFRGKRRSVAWGAEPRLVISDKYFDVPPDVLEELRSVRARRNRQDDIERTHDAFLLDPGFGPPTYLSADGRILWDDDGWGVEAELGWAYAAIVTGSRKLSLPSLLKLLPSRPAGTPDCPECEGTGEFTAKGQLKDVNGKTFSIGCGACWGMGWQAIPGARSAVPPAAERLD